MEHTLRPDTNQTGHLERVNSIDEIDLANLKWNVVSSYDREPQKDGSHYTECTFETTLHVDIPELIPEGNFIDEARYVNVRINGECKIYQLKGGTTDYTHIEYIFYMNAVEKNHTLQQPITLLRGRVRFNTIDNGDKPTSTKIYVGRTDRKNRILPPGTGMVFYKKLLDFLESIQSSRDIVHVVTREPEDDPDEASWHLHFDRVLLERGYTPLDGHGPGIFEKTYPAKRVANASAEFGVE